MFHATCRRRVYGRVILATRTAAVLLALASFDPGARAASEPPSVTAEEWALTEFPGEPGAPAVVLFEKGEFWMMDPERQRMSSLMRVHTRLKILTDAGKSDWSDLSILHSRGQRLTEVEAWVLHPDGRREQVAETAIFRDTLSERGRFYATKVAFPGVEVGSILDYTYDLRYESIFNLEPWRFQGPLPVVHSEILYYVPESIAVSAWDRVTLPGAKLEQSMDRDSNGRRVRFWMENLTSVPDEPFSFPSLDLDSRLMLYPTRQVFGGTWQQLFDDWEGTVEVIGFYYEEARRSTRQAKKKAKEIAAAAGSERSRAERSRAESIYRFVRDEITTIDSGAVWTSDDQTVDNTLEKREGTSADQALLLAVMLEAEKIDSELVWASYRSAGAVNPTLPTPYWFDKVLVEVVLDGKTHYLDPSDRRLAFGAMEPDHEGTLALRAHSKKPEIIRLSASAPESSVRQARLELEVDGEGRVHGTARFTYRGHHATTRFELPETQDDLIEAWQARADTAFEGWKANVTRVAENVEESKIEVEAEITSTTEGGLTEVTLLVAAPHATRSNPFVLTPAERQTPLLLPFPESTDLETHITWSPEWEADLLPESATRTNDVGHYYQLVDFDQVARTLFYRRKTVRNRREFLDPTQYGALRDLYQAAETHDAQSLVLVRSDP